MMKKWSISGLKVQKSDKTIKAGTVTISQGKILKVASEKPSTQLSLEIEDGVIFPGFFNSHDHLLGNYLPKVGKGPYENWLPWDNDLKSSPVYVERQQIENRDLYLLGAYRNLVSGVTTVADHIPHFVGDPYYPLLPIKAVTNFALAHSVASFALAWGDGIQAEHEKAVKNDIPFLTHCSEGYDRETVDDIKTLDRLGALTEHAVLFHGLAFSESDMKLIKQRGASVVWCADSNYFMYNDTTNIKMLLDMGINVCIGTDSPMSGGENLLYEMKFGKKLYRDIYGEELSDEAILKMVTLNPARAFRLPKQGKIEEGAVADLVVFTDRGGSPASSAVGAGLPDVRLVVIDGRPVYGDAAYAHIFEELEVPAQEITLAGSRKVITGDLVGLMRRISRAVGFKKEFTFLPVAFDIS